MTASQSRLGKPVFSDLREGKLTLPFILLLPLLAPAQRAAVADVLSSGEFRATGPEELRSWLDQHGIIEQCRAVATEHGRRAGAAIAGLPATSEHDRPGGSPRVHHQPRVLSYYSRKSARHAQVFGAV